LLARYDATADAHPALAERLRPLRAEVARHAEAFGGPGRPGAAPRSSSGAASPSRTGGNPAGDAARREEPADAPAPGVPVGEQDALAALAEAERRTTEVRTKTLTGAAPELARLLASVAAAGAAHAYLLAEGR
jgi:hypothetical protein